MEKERLPSIKGSIPSVTELPADCPFHPRCPYAEKGRCDVGDRPPLEEFGKDHTAACIKWKEVASARDNYLPKSPYPPERSGASKIIQE